MNKNITFWSFRVPMTPRDHLNLRAAVTQERKYYNGLVAQLSGPMRTMPDVLKSFAGLGETAFGMVAVAGGAVRTVLAEARFSTLLSDPKAALILEAARSPGVIHGEMRKAIAIEVLRAARDMTAAMHNTLKPTVTDDHVYRHAVETLVEHDDKTKRHVQIVKSLCTVTKRDDDRTAIQTPYTTSPIVVPMPDMNWNLLVLREEENRREGDEPFWLIEFHDVKANYLVRKTDPIIRARKRTKTRNQSSRTAGPYAPAR